VTIRATKVGCYGVDDDEHHIADLRDEFSERCSMLLDVEMAPLRLSFLARDESPIEQMYLVKVGAGRFKAGLIVSAASSSQPMMITDPSGCALSVGPEASPRYRCSECTGNLRFSKPRDTTEQFDLAKSDAVLPKPPDMFWVHIC
jgi:hypothetical protein